MPFAVRSRSGISSARRRYTLPKFEKNSRCACAVVKITWRTMSSAFRYAAPAARLGLELRRRDRLDVLRLGHHDDELFVVDEILDRHLAGLERDLAHAGRCELLLDRAELVLDDAAQQRGVAEDRLELP